MSEKLNYQLVGAKEIFHDGELIPERALIFEGPNLHEEVSFPKYGTTLIFDGEIYDWFGRKVIKNKSIVEIIHYLGTLMGNDYSNETFIVRDTRGRLSITWVEYDPDWDQKYKIEEEINKLPNCSQIWRAVFNISYDRLHRELYCVDTGLYFNNFILPTSASRPPILNAIDPQKEMVVIPECWIEGSRKKTFPLFFNVEQGTFAPYGQMWQGEPIYDFTHIVYAKRSDILKNESPLFEDSQLEDFDISPDEPLDMYTDLEKYSAKMAKKLKKAEYELNRNRREAQENKIKFTSKISFSKNGEKMYANLTCGRCATDMEIMQMASKRNTIIQTYFYWYLS